MRPQTGYACSNLPCRRVVNVRLASIKDIAAKSTQPCREQPRVRDLSTSLGKNSPEVRATRTISCVRVRRSGGILEQSRLGTRVADGHKGCSTTSHQGSC